MRAHTLPTEHRRGHTYQPFDTRVCPGFTWAVKHDSKSIGPFFSILLDRKRELKKRLNFFSPNQSVYQSRVSHWADRLDSWMRTKYIYIYRLYRYNLWPVWPTNLWSDLSAQCSKNTLGWRPLSQRTDITCSLLDRQVKYSRKRTKYIYIYINGVYTYILYVFGYLTCRLMGRHPQNL